MSCANMGVSQLECLQLRRLVGPTGIGAFQGQLTRASTVVPIKLSPLGSGGYEGLYTSPFKVPSGTGLIRFRMQTTINAADSIKFYAVQIGGDYQATIVPTFVALGNSYWFAEETIVYNNPSSSPVPINAIVSTNNTATTCTVTLFEADIISFGPYVQQE